MTAEPLLFELTDGIARLTINRASRKNAVTAAMWRDLADRVAALPSSTRVLVLAGAGTDFCAGADIGEFETVRRDADTAMAYEQANSDAFRTLREAAFPTIAAIRGICFGGGFGLAAACDLRIGAPGSLFSVPAARLGLAYPTDAMADIVAACGPQLAKYLLFSAARIDAAEALAAGFLLEIADDPVARALAIAASIAEAAPLSARASKAAIRAVMTGDSEIAIEAARLGAATFDSADYAEGRAAFRQKRRPVFSGR